MSGRDPASQSRAVLAAAAWHSLLWLVIANVVGVLLAAMLVLPGLNRVLVPFTYGRWMPVHINLQLYGWCSLPLVAFLLHAYRADRGPCARWSVPVLWAWTSALGVGSLSWLGGHSSGKLFLDWVGYPRLVFPMALLGLWALLTAAFAADWTHTPCVARAAKVAGLVLLFAVPFLLFFASSPAVYPPINPDSGGPTGASQLESTLVILAILLALPYGLFPKRPRTRIQTLAWVVFVAECVLCLGLGRADVSHHKPAQWISLGSLLLWIPLLPAFFGQFPWHAGTRMWRIAFLCWWAVLVPTGWALFLPGVLDRVKFTDGLVAHSLLAMGGFVSSLLILILVELLGDDGWIFTRPWSFRVWQASIAVYVAIMFYAGWREGANPAFAMAPGPVRNVLYVVRLLLGVLILAASLDWFVDCFTLLRELRERAPAAAPTHTSEARHGVPAAEVVL